MLNYRGSIGFGAAWRDALIGNIGWPEVEDLVAGHDDLLAQGSRIRRGSAIAGWSWGGYLTLLTQGMHPDRFISGVAGVPVADYVLGVRRRVAAPPGVRPGAPRRRAGGRAAADAASGPRSSTSTASTAPLLITAGENDSRCPLPPDPRPTSSG